MNPLIIDLPKHTKYIKLLEDISKKTGDISIFGLTQSQKAHMIYSLAAYSKKPTIIVCSNVLQARRVIQDLKFYSEIEIIFFPARDMVYYNLKAESKEIENQRMYAIQKILKGTNNIVVTTIDALTQKMLPRSIYGDLDFYVEKGLNIDLSELVIKLDKLGYVRSTTVEGKGQFAIRGGIIDVFPVDSLVPYRIELFGDEIDSIRIFDVFTQRSIESVHKISIMYASEFMYSTKEINHVVDELNKELQKPKLSDALKNIIQEDIEKIKSSEYESLVDKYFELFTKNYETLLDYVKNYTVYIDEPVKCIERAKNIIYENNETLKMLAEKNYIDVKYVNKYLSYEEIEMKFKHMTNVYLETINTDRILHAKRKDYSFSCREVNFFRSSVDVLIQGLQKCKKEGKITILVYPVATKVEAVKNQLIDNGVKVTYLENINIKEKLEYGEVYITQGILSGGYVYEDFNLCVIAESVSGTNFNKIKKANKDFIGQKINTYDDLELDDYVVHENHGIGIYKGIHTVNVGGIFKDYIKIVYSDNGVLYVPITQLDSVKKYMCDDSTVPKLSTLGSKEWQKTKKKVDAHVKQIAKELMILYAKRNEAKGYRFDKDTPWQYEFEDTFKYELTDDQKVALREIKEDMEKDIPMDRLLCGDVGYGKTELALRATFKAVMDSKQVAYLVPTTVLALQQFRTFKERMEAFSVNVEMLSRFRSQAEQKKIIKKLADGEIDILIGTHRILSGDVVFKDLALLIIDEEHRFGVKDKESIKKLKENIDVLSMTATPIPRTLHMSMIGIRQMSTLSEPPLERIPVHTYVLEYDENIVKEAIEKELSRDGQVIYVNNRVDGIEDLCEKVRKLVPEARVAFAHGQMDPRDIEDIMIKYMEHEIDVIVCTTILESGIDIQNANTLIVENADKLGLAQLYQIRGRVGRSSRLAYAYITYEKHKQISEIASKRLKAIKDFTEFGSGFKIALRDLEIRGAGNLFGKQQHGHMASVGYELYIAMLEKAIDEEKNIQNNETDKKPSILSDINKEVKIEIDVSAYIPDDYISDLSQKILTYQMISNIKDTKDSMDVVDNLLDRFGEIPKETENLIKVVEIRNMARSIGITKIVQKSGYVIFEPSNLKFWLTNEASSDILTFVQIALRQIENMIIKGKKES